VAKASDIGGKRLLGLAPDAWARWVTQQADVTALEILGSEFQWVSRENDVLMKVHSPMHGEFLILNELQLRYTNKMPLRMSAYAALAQERYGLPVYPVLVNILPPSSGVVIRNRFESDFLGLQSRQDFHVINLWEVDAETVFERSLDTLLPFVPILKDGGNQQTVRRALVQLQQNEELVELESLLGFWDMTVLRESPWYQEIQQEGRQEGEKSGALKEGQSLILRLLTRRIGEVAPEMRLQVQALSLAQLEALGEALLDFSEPADLDEWLRTHSVA